MSHYARIDVPVWIDCNDDLSSICVRQALEEPLPQIEQDSWLMQVVQTSHVWKRNSNRQHQKCHTVSICVAY
jgi:hypothetical protein